MVAKKFLLMKEGGAIGLFKIQDHRFGTCGNSAEKSAFSPADI